MRCKADGTLLCSKLTIPHRHADIGSTRSSEMATAVGIEAGRSPSLAAVVQQATLRAEALLSNAKCVPLTRWHRAPPVFAACHKPVAQGPGGTRAGQAAWTIYWCLSGKSTSSWAGEASVACWHDTAPDARRKCVLSRTQPLHLRACPRLAMLDPAVFMARWKATAIAKTDLVVLQMTREGLELFLQQNPLAQVHLRASMAKARAELVKLEALEKISVAHQQQCQLQQQRARRRNRDGTAARKHGGIVASRPRPSRRSVEAAGETAVVVDTAASTLAPSSAAVAQSSLTLPADTRLSVLADAEVGQGHDAGVEDSSSSEDEALVLAGIPGSTLELFNLVSNLRSAIGERAAAEAAPGGALSALAGLSANLASGSEAVR